MSEVYTDTYIIKKMSERSRILLCMIDENTDVDWEDSQEVFQYFHGHDFISKGVYVSFQEDPVFLWEQRDGRILKGLIDKKLIEQMFRREPRSLITTEYGHKIAEHVLSLLQKDNRKDGN